VSALVGALLGVSAVVFGVIAIAKPGWLARRFDRRDDWMIVKEQERPFDPRATQAGGVVFIVAGVALVAMAALGVFG